MNRAQAIIQLVKCGFTGAEAYDATTSSLEMKANDGEGRWVTINGHHVFVGGPKEDESTSSSLLPSSAFSTIGRYRTSEEWTRSIDGENNPFEKWSHESSSNIRAMDANPPKIGSMSPKEERLLETINKMKLELLKAPLYHGEAFRGLNNLSNDAIHQLTSVGGEIKLNSFTSFTSDKSVAHGYLYGSGQKNSVLFHIVQSKSGVDIHRLSSYPGEKEIIFQKGATFKITKVSMDPDRQNHYNVRLEEIGA